MSTLAPVNFILFWMFGQLAFLDRGTCLCTTLQTRWNSTGFRRRLCPRLLWPWPLIPKANQHIYEHKYVCDQNWVKFPSLHWEIWCSQGFLVIAWCDLDVLPFDLISMSQVLIHTSPDFCEISSNIYEYIVFTRGFSGQCLLWPWPLNIWPNQYVLSPNTYVA